MKRAFTLILMLFATVGVVMGQGKVRDFSKYEKQLTKSDEAIANPKKSLNPKTWTARAELMEEIYNALLYDAQPGMDAQLFTILCGFPTAKREETVAGQEYQVFQMPRTDFYFQNGQLAFANVTKPIVSNPLEQAYTCYTKAIELDPKGKLTKSITKALTHLRGLISNEGVNEYSQAKYDEALKSFDLSLRIAQMPQLNLVDTALCNYAGVAAFQAQKYELSANYFKKCIEYGYYQGGDIFCTYYEAMRADNKAKEAFPMLEKGVELFPEQQCLILNMIQHNILMGDDPEKVIPYVDKAIEKNPQNHVLYFVRGVVYNQLEKPEKALEAYDEAIKIKPDFVDAYYNIAALHFNQGVNLQNKAVENKDNYDALMDQAAASFQRSIAPAEKVLELDPNHMQALDLLRILYFRNRQLPGMQEKYNKVYAKIQELKAQGAK